MKVAILAGGKGIRLWPMSWEETKQFLKLIDGKSLLEATYERILKLLIPEDIVTITNKDYYFYVKDTYPKFSSNLEKNIICEPLGRNTCPAIALGVKYAVEELNSSPDEIFYVFPSDHIDVLYSRIISRNFSLPRVSVYELERKLINGLSSLLNKYCNM